MSQLKSQSTLHIRPELNFLSCCQGESIYIPRLCVGVHHRTPTGAHSQGRPGNITSYSIILGKRGPECPTPSAKHQGYADRQIRGFPK